MRRAPAARLAFIAWAAALAPPAPARAEAVDVDVGRRYGGITLASIGQAIDDARTRFRSHPGDRITLHLPAGVFSLAAVVGGPVRIDVSHIRPGEDGRLIVQGAGRRRTTLVFDGSADEIFGRDTTRVTFAGLHFTLARMTVTQGRVERATPEAVDLRIDEGFPTPADLFNPASGRGRYLRRCTGRDSAPQIDQAADNAQVPWRMAEPLGGESWRLDLQPSRSGSRFAVGDLIAVKSKAAQGNAYRFIGGSDVAFEDVTWTRLTRGVFRGGMDRVRISNSSIERDPPVRGHVPCLASAAGGPQIGQPNDPFTAGAVIDHFTAAGTGDDAIAFFNASGTVSHVAISDAFARGILLSRSPAVRLEDVRLERAPLERD